MESVRRAGAFAERSTRTNALAYQCSHAGIMMRRGAADRCAEGGLRMVAPSRPRPSPSQFLDRNEHVLLVGHGRRGQELGPSDMLLPALRPDHHGWLLPRPGPGPSQDPIQDLYGWSSKACHSGLFDDPTSATAGRSAPTGLCWTSIRAGDTDLHQLYRSTSPDSRRRPDHQEGLRIATPLLADIPDTDQFDSEWESRFGSSLVDPHRSTLLWRVARVHRALRSQPGLLRRSRAHGGEAGQPARGHPRPARHVAGEGCRRAKAAARQEVCPIPSPRQSSHLLRDLQIQFTIAVLQRVGVKPRGHVSGCYIVSEALELSEGNVSLSGDSVKRIWDRPFMPEFRKHSKGIATRTGPFHPTEA